MTASAGGRIFHLLTAERWAEEQPAQTVPAARFAVDQFERHGFVHCCFREQITEIASWWFDAGAQLVAVELDASRIRAEVRYEASPTRWYPHVYGPLDADAVVASYELPRAPTGVTALPASLATPPPSYRLLGQRSGSPAMVRWQDGELDGDRAWIADTRAGIEAGTLIELLGGVMVPATLATPYESFASLVRFVDELVRYDGDGFTED